MLRLVRQWIATFAGTAPMEIEEYALEHLLLYHGLIGTSPGSEPRWQQLAEQIQEAVADRSCAQFGNVLKVPPLWWQEHLLPIFAAINNASPNNLSLLLADQNPQADLLLADNWQVRANAANALAAFAGASATLRLEQALAKCFDDNFKAAFPHIAYALGSLQTDSGRATLLSYLHSEEPWFRVDAARALTQFPAASVANDLLDGLLDHHSLTDYMAVVVAQRYGADQLLKLCGSASREGALELILGVLQAANETFTADVVTQTKVNTCLPELLISNPSEPSARYIRAVLGLSNWLKKQRGEELTGQVNEKLLQFQFALETPNFQSHLIRRLDAIAQKSNEGCIDTRHTIILCGELGLTDTVPKLITLLNPEFVAFNETIEALGTLGDPSAAKPLMEIVHRLVNMEQRTSTGLSRQPVVESNPKVAESYWLILRSLGSLVSTEALDFLYRAINDFAPDKREQALQSLIAVYSANGSHHCDSKQMMKVLSQALRDPSTQVQKIALKGVAQLSMVELLPSVRKNCAASERSLSDAAFDVFAKLYARGCTDPVLKELRKGAAWDWNSNLRGRYGQLAASLSSKEDVI